MKFLRYLLSCLLLLESVYVQATSKLDPAEYLLHAPSLQRHWRQRAGVDQIDWRLQASESSELKQILFLPLTGADISELILSLYRLYHPEGSLRQLQRAFKTLGSKQELREALANLDFLTVTTLSDEGKVLAKSLDSTGIYSYRLDLARLKSFFPELRFVPLAEEPWRAAHWQDSATLELRTPGEQLLRVSFPTRFEEIPDDLTSVPLARNPVTPCLLQALADPQAPEWAKLWLVHENVKGLNAVRGSWQGIGDTFDFYWKQNQLFPFGGGKNHIDRFQMQRRVNDFVRSEGELATRLVGVDSQGQVTDSSRVFYHYLMDTDKMSSETLV